MTMTPVAQHGARLVTEHPHLMANYGRGAVQIVRGEGVYLFDESGNGYIDLVAGIAVCALGHAHPRITRAIADQAATLVHCSNLYHHEPAGTVHADGAKTKLLRRDNEVNQPLVGGINAVSVSRWHGADGK